MNITIDNVRTSKFIRQRPNLNLLISAPKYNAKKEKDTISFSGKYEESWKLEKTLEYLKNRPLEILKMNPTTEDKKILSSLPSLKIQIQRTITEPDDRIHDISYEYFDFMARFKPKESIDTWSNEFVAQKVTKGIFFPKQVMDIPLYTGVNLIHAKVALESVETARQQLPPHQAEQMKYSIKKSLMQGLEEAKIENIRISDTVITRIKGYIRNRLNLELPRNDKTPLALKTKTALSESVAQEKHSDIIKKFGPEMLNDIFNCKYASPNEQVYELLKDQEIHSLGKILSLGELQKLLKINTIDVGAQAMMSTSGSSLIIPKEEFRIWSAVKPKTTINALLKIITSPDPTPAPVTKSQAIGYHVAGTRNALTHEYSYKFDLSFKYLENAFNNLIRRPHEYSSAVELPSLAFETSEKLLLAIKKAEELGHNLVNIDTGNGFSRKQIIANFINDVLIPKMSKTDCYNIKNLLNKCI